MASTGLTTGNLSIERKVKKNTAALISAGSTSYLVQFPDKTIFGIANPADLLDTAERDSRLSQTGNTGWSEIGNKISNKLHVLTTEK